MTDEGSIRCSGSYAEILSTYPELLSHTIYTETVQLQHNPSVFSSTSSQKKPRSVCDAARSADSKGSLTTVEGRAQGAVKAEVYKFYAAAMGRNYLIAVLLAGALAQVDYHVSLYLAS
jgi:hypothetical protein